MSAGKRGHLMTPRHGSHTAEHGWDGSWNLQLLWRHLVPGSAHLQRVCLLVVSVCVCLCVFVIRCNASDRTS